MEAMEGTPGEEEERKAEKDSGHIGGVKVAQLPLLLITFRNSHFLRSRTRNGG
jgi:hypothetical protein